MTKERNVRRLWDRRREKFVLTIKVGKEKDNSAPTQAGPTVINIGITRKQWDPNMGRKTSLPYLCSLVITSGINLESLPHVTWKLLREKCHYFLLNICICMNKLHISN